MIEKLFQIEQLDLTPGHKTGFIKFRMIDPLTGKAGDMGNSILLNLPAEFIRQHKLGDEFRMKLISEKEMDEAQAFEHSKMEATNG